jgi:uncharacterized membrane protein YesL
MQGRYKMNLFQHSNHLMKSLYMILKLTGFWWFLNVPYVLLGAYLWGAPDVTTVHTMGITGLMLLPFVAIPATVTTLALARRYVKSDEELPFLKVFWKYYKRDYVKSMILGIINTTVLTVFYLSIRYYAGISPLLAIFFYTLVFVTPFFFLYVYSFLVDQELPLKAYLSNSMMLLFKHPINGLLMIFEIFAATYIIWMVFPPLLFFILPGLVALLSTYFYQKSMRTEFEKWQINLELNTN